MEINENLSLPESQMGLGELVEIWKEQQELVVPYIDLASQVQLDLISLSLDKAVGTIFISTEHKEIFTKHLGLSDTFVEDDRLYQLNVYNVWFKEFGNFIPDISAEYKLISHYHKLIQDIPEPQRALRLIDLIKFSPGQIYVDELYNLLSENFRMLPPTDFFYVIDPAEENDDEINFLDTLPRITHQLAKLKDKKLSEAYINLHNYLLDCAQNVSLLETDSDLAGAIFEYIAYSPAIPIPDKIKLVRHYLNLLKDIGDIDLLEEQFVSVDLICIDEDDDLRKDLSEDLMHMIDTILDFACRVYASIPNYEQAQIYFEQINDPDLAEYLLPDLIKAGIRSNNLPELSAFLSNRKATVEAAALDNLDSFDVDATEQEITNDLDDLYDNAWFIAAHELARSDVHIYYYPHFLNSQKNTTDIRLIRGLKSRVYNEETAFLDFVQYAIETELANAQLSSNATTHDRLTYCEALEKYILFRAYTKR